MKASIQIQPNSNPPKIISIDEVLKKEGIYIPVSNGYESIESRIVVCKYGVETSALYIHTSGAIQPVCRTCWLDYQFIKMDNESLNIQILSCA